MPWHLKVAGTFHVPWHSKVAGIFHVPWPAADGTWNAPATLSVSELWSSAFQNIESRPPPNDFANDVHYHFRYDSILCFEVAY